MSILNEDIIKRLSGDPNELNLTADVKTQAANSGESDVCLFTGKDSWAEGDLYYNSALDAGYKFAISFIRSNANEQEQQQIQEFNLAVEICKQIRTNLDSRGLLVTSESVIEGIDQMAFPSDPSEPIILNDYTTTAEGISVDDFNTFYP